MGAVEDVALSLVGVVDEESSRESDEREGGAGEAVEAVLAEPNICTSSSMRCVSGLGRTLWSDCLLTSLEEVHSSVITANWEHESRLAIRREVDNLHGAP